MASESQNIRYSFLDFKFTPNQHQFQHCKHQINLSKKNHDLLLALVLSNGNVIEKDDLIAQVWPNQIVTDAALNKQITRLRQLLAEYDSSPMIETIRGVGVRFICELHIENIEPDTTKQARKHSVAVVTLILVATFWVLWQLKQHQTKENTGWHKTETINMAIIPALNSSDWLNTGALNHLSGQLLAYQEIQTITPEHNWFEHDNNDVLGIELAERPGIEFVLMVENLKKDNHYIANLLLRNKDQIVAKHSLQADTVSLLLNQVETWTLAQLDISTEIIKNQQQSQPVATDFVMESYLRGLSAARSRSYDKAKQLLNTAIEQDPDFYPAWITLADVESELGRFDKALGLINTLISSKKLNEQQRLKLSPIQVKNLIYLNRLEEAQTLLNESMQQAEAKQDINVIMYNMNNQLVLNDYKGIDDISDITLGQKLLALTEKFDPSPDVIGVRQHNLAVSLNEASMEPQAIEMIQLAIENFRISNNYEGILSSYRVWSDVHAYLAQFPEAQLALNQAEPYLAKVEGARTLVNYWKAYGWVHYELGDLTATQTSIDTLNQLSIQYASQDPKITALIIETEMSIAHQQLNRARNAVDSLLEIMLKNPEAYPIDAPYTAALDMYLTAVMNPISDAKAKKAQYLAAYPGLENWIKNELMVIDALILSADGFKQQAVEKLLELENRYIATRDICFANDTNYVLLRLLIGDLENETSQKVVKAALERLAGRDHFVYPYKKFKAQWLAHKKQMIQAISLMIELKAQANDFWNPEDQLLLERWQANNSQL